MSQFDDLITAFKDNMGKTALFVNGNDQTDIQTGTGYVPTLAKLVRLATEQLAGVSPDLSQRLFLGGDGNYSNAQKAWGRTNLGLDKVDNTADAEKPLSAAQQTAIQAVLDFAKTREDPTKRNVVNGYFAYDGAKLPIRNGADNLFGYLYHNSTALRNWMLPDQSGTIALKSDITGNNTGTNTGDETTATIKAKLNITTLSGANTGDETRAGILTKLNVPDITGTNTGDETHASIISKIGYDVMPIGARNAINGVAPLDENRMVPAENLPAAFESVAVYANVGALPQPGIAKRLYVTSAENGLYYWNGVYTQINIALNNTDQLGEGATNKYFTQLRAVGAALTGFRTDLTSDVTATDSVVAAISKLQAQLKVAITDYTNQAQAAITHADQGLATKEALSNKATDFTVVNHTKYPTVQAAKAYADSILTGVVRDCGNWDASTNAFPTTGGTGAAGAIVKGNLWYVSVAGNLGGKAVNIGDSFRALVDAPGQTAGNWGVLESNIGYVPYNATNPAGYISAITAQMVKDALGVTTISGSNTGDETLATIQAKLGSTTNLSEGNNLYFTTARVLGTALTGFAVAGANAAVVAADSVVTAFGKQQKQINDLKTANTGDETQATIVAKLGYTPASKAGDTFGFVNSTGLIHGADKITAEDNIETRKALRAGGVTGYGGCVYYKHDGDVDQWLEGIYPGAGQRDWQLRDLINNRTIMSVNSGSGLLTVQFGIDVSGPINTYRGLDVNAADTTNLTAANVGSFLYLKGNNVTVNNVTLTEGFERVCRIDAGASVQFVASANLLLPGGVNLNTKAGDIVVLRGVANGVVQVTEYIPAGNYSVPDPVKTLTANTATTILDLSQAPVFEVTLSANTAFVFDFSNVPPLSNQMFEFVLTIINDGTAGRGVSFPANTKWAGNQIPERTTAANARDDWYFYSRDGVNWTGSLSNKDVR